MVKRCLMNELEMPGWHGALKRKPHLFDIRFTVYTQGLPGILLKCSFSSGDRSQPDVTGSFKKIHHHLLMIAPQADHSFGILAAELHDKSNATRCICTAVNQVAEKDYRIGAHVAWQHIEQFSKLLSPAVYITPHEF